MRVDDRKPGPAQPERKSSFAAELKKAAPLPAARPAARPLPAKVEARPVAARTAAAKPVVGKAAARSKEAVSFQKALEARRGETEAHRPEHKRFALEVARRLEREAQPQPVEPAPKLEAPPTVQSQPAPVEAAPAPVRAEALAEQIAALLERVEVVQRAEGPALELALADCAAAQVRVTRTGKGEVALALSARTPAERRALQAQVGRVRASLQARGLRVRDVVVS